MTTLVVGGLYLSLLSLNIALFEVSNMEEELTALQLSLVKPTTSHTTDQCNIHKYVLIITKQLYA